MCYLRNFSVGFTALVILLLFLAMVVLPQYSFSVSGMDGGDINLQCSKSTNRYWFKEKCEADNSRCNGGFVSGWTCDSTDGEVSWRNRCNLDNTTTTRDCTSLTKLYDTTLAFYCLSFILTLAFFGVMIMRCIGRMQNRNKLNGLLGLAGWLCLVIAVGVFANGHAKAFKEDYGANCNGFAFKTKYDGDQSPCLTLYGGVKFINLFAWTWYSTAWIVACVALGFYTFVVCCAFAKSIEPQSAHPSTDYQPLTVGAYVPPQGGYAYNPNQPHMQYTPQQYGYGQPGQPQVAIAMPVTYAANQQPPQYQPQGQPQTTTSAGMYPPMQ